MTRSSPLEVSSAVRSSLNLRYNLQISFRHLRTVRLRSENYIVRACVYKNMVRNRVSAVDSVSSLPANHSCNCIYLNRALLAGPGYTSAYVLATWTVTSSSSWKFPNAQLCSCMSMPDRSSLGLPIQQSKINRSIIIEDHPPISAKTIRTIHHSAAFVHKKTSLLTKK